VLVEGRRVLAAKEHVLPLLDLLLERDRRAQDGLLGLEVVAADAGELLGGAIDAAQCRERYGEHDGEAARHQEEDLGLEAADLHGARYVVVIILEKGYVLRAEEL